MLTREEAYDIIQTINEDAHNAAWDTWERADELSDSINEEDWDLADQVREEASAEQSEHFRRSFNELDEETREAILHYVDTDEDFKEEFVAWYGPDDFEEDIWFEAE